MLGYRFSPEHHILAHFCQTLSPSKAQKISSQKPLCFGTKRFGDIDPRQDCKSQNAEQENGAKTLA
jgi:hypothetical protein